MKLCSVQADVSAQGFSGFSHVELWKGAVRWAGVAFLHRLKEGKLYSHVGILRGS